MTNLNSKISYLMLCIFLNYCISIYINVHFTIWTLLNTYQYDFMFCSNINLTYTKKDYIIDKFEFQDKLFNVMVFSDELFGLSLYKSTLPFINITPNALTATAVLIIVPKFPGS